MKDYKWMHIDEILSYSKNNPSPYTIWLKQAYPKLHSKINK